MVRLLRGPGEGSPEAVNEDDDAAVAEGEGITPQPERVREAQMGRQQRVRFLARQEGCGARDPDHERVDRLGERCPPQLDRSEQGLGVGDGRRSREHGRRSACPPQRAENAATNRFRRGREAEPQRGACDALGRLGVVRVAAQQPGEPRVVEDE